ncbi:hypothetical protein KEM56_000454 [Ascosphaera pollenicola]|nr:hypothetical protein KEM56_000454 [Ascosphaera pollenicola]
MAPTLSYPKTSDNTVKRHKERASYELEAIHKLVNSSPVVHVSFNVPGSDFPAILPMIGQMGSFEYPSADLDEPMDCYLHGYVSSRIMNLGRDEPDNKGMPVCISTAKVDGILLNLGHSNHSYNFRSAILHGYAKVVTDPEEKSFASTLTTDSLVPEQSKYTRPPTKAEMASAQFLRVKIVDASAKLRSGAGDDVMPEKDNPDAQKKIWTGVIPMWERFGEPVPSGINEVQEVPEHVMSYVARMNKENEEYARGAVPELLKALKKRWFLWDTAGCVPSATEDREAVQRLQRVQGSDGSVQNASRGRETVRRMQGLQGSAGDAQDDLGGSAKLREAPEVIRTLWNRSGKRQSYSGRSE